MREISSIELEQWKLTLEKGGIAYESDDDYREALDNLISFFEILIEADKNHNNQ